MIILDTLDSSWVVRWQIASCLPYLHASVFKYVKLICPPSTEERELLNILHNQHIPAANIWLLPLWNLPSYFHLILQLLGKETLKNLYLGTCICWEWEGIQKVRKSNCFLPWPTDLLIPCLTQYFLFANFTKYIPLCSVTDKSLSMIFWFFFHSLHVLRII